MSEIRQSEKGNIFSSGQCGPVAKKLILKMLFWPTSDPLLLAPRAVKQDKNRLILLDESNSNLSCSLLGQFLVRVVTKFKNGVWGNKKRISHIETFTKGNPDTQITEIKLGQII